MHIVIHYSDIGTKGGNRAFFERKLVENISCLLGRNYKIFRRYGRIVLKPNLMHNVEKILPRLAFIPGISSYALAKRAKLELEDIEKKTKELLNGEKFATFRVTATRSNKNFPLSSQEVNVKIGDFIRQKLLKKVKLNKPDRDIRIEIGEKEAFIYFEKYPGIGGLPVGSSGVAVASLSGGIDSPVASYLGMRKGLKVVFVHILNRTIGGNREGQAKIKKIVQELTKYQGKSKLYIVPFEEIQQSIITCTLAPLRMIIYRRFMMRILEKVASRENASGIITGDSLGQVASQTIENIGCIYQGLNLPILPPLVGANKEEIIKLAKEIGTYTHSILPYPDCCSFMIAKHPETRGKIDEVKKVEEAIVDKERMVQDCVEKAAIEFIE